MDRQSPSDADVINGYVDNFFDVIAAKIFVYIRWYNMWQYRNLPVKKITREIGREISVVCTIFICDKTQKSEAKLLTLRK